jgi:hypothetical protein
MDFSQGSSPELNALVLRFKCRINELEQSLVLAEECKERLTNEINKLSLQLEYSSAGHEDEIRSLRESRELALRQLKHKVSDETEDLQAALTESKSTNTSLLTSIEGLERRLYSIGDEASRNDQLRCMEERINHNLMNRLGENKRAFIDRICTLSGLVRDQALELESLHRERTRMELMIKDLERDVAHLHNINEQSTVSSAHTSDLQKELDSRAGEIDRLTEENRRLRLMGMHFLHRHIDSVP